MSPVAYTHLQVAGDAACVSALLAVEAEKVVAGSRGREERCALVVPQLREGEVAVLDSVQRTRPI